MGFAQKKVSGTLQANKLLEFERLKVPDTFFWAKRYFPFSAGKSLYENFRVTLSAA